MRFTLKQLEYFVATAETGSIKSASDRINISAPSISAAIAQLESQLDVQLFIRRHAQGLSLTGAGKRIVEEARLLLKQAEQLHTIAAETRDEVTGGLNIGCMVTLAPIILPELLRRFAARYPQVDLSVSDGSHEQVVERLRTTEVDAAISYDLSFPDDIAFRPLAKLPPYVVLPRNHKLAKSASLSLSDLVTEPLVLLDLPYSREYFASLFQHKKLKPKIAGRSSNIEVVRSMVANGFGYTIANARPKNQHTQDGKKLVNIPLKGQHKPMVIGLATRRKENKTRLSIAFEQHCHNMIYNNNIPGMQSEAGC